MKKHLTLPELQQHIKAKDFKPDKKLAYFLKLSEEVGELAEVIRKDKRLAAKKSIKGTIEEELADVLYYVLALANVYDIDLEHCFHLKEKLNQAKYE
ncbi:MazG nucleotide pyrophosphohydrolase domain-containing protein [Tumebacillus flagellatus]|uniref:NTP pyrophosphohydrolase MazG-like domain-containing protein n=1 Tax=Tumebacillus flagellatus TaxID=1157490 RepID=A0A074LMQ0_9BACL|nr:MazG nucleotide pyrophosphohydrolase domain-containing protein [Tumebacillus flagellatus]KEO82414.1 hypothetical protein EL26_15145 [Tumebacillus flagellatus]